MNVRNALLIVAGLLVTAGVWFVFWPAALIVAGLLTGTFVLLTDE